MNRTPRTAAAKALAVAGLLLLASSARAQSSFLYTNDNTVANNFQLAPNLVSGFSIGASGELAPIPGSPFLTGGKGNGKGAFLPSIMTTTAGNFLYVANTGDDSVSGFSINPTTGALTLVPGSPFPVPQSQFVDISLAVSPDGRYLYAANGQGYSITAYKIGPDGSLSQVGVSTLSTFPNSVKVSPNGKFVAASLAFNLPPNLVAMYDIESNGALQSVSGSPFSLGTLTSGSLPEATSLDINCDSSLIFVSPVSEDTSVGVLSIAPDGVLTPVAGSVFSLGGGTTNSLALSPNNKFLFGTNPENNTVTSLSVGAGGTLTSVPGSPFTDPAIGPAETTAYPTGLATTQDGKLLYVVNTRSTSSGLNDASSITGFSVASDGTLSPVPGAPVYDGIPSNASVWSLAVFPPKICCAPPIISNISATPDQIRPGDHKMVEVTVSYDVSHDCPSTCTLAVSSSDPDESSADGGKSPDWQVLDMNHVLLRAKRGSDHGELTYTITVTCTTPSGSSTSQSTTVTVRRHERECPPEKCNKDDEDHETR